MKIRNNKKQEKYLFVKLIIPSSLLGMKSGLPSSIFKIFVKYIPKSENNWSDYGSKTIWKARDYQKEKDGDVSSSWKEASVVK